MHKGAVCPLLMRVHRQLIDANKNTPEVVSPTCSAGNWLPITICTGCVAGTRHTLSAVLGSWAPPTCRMAQPGSHTTTASVDDGFTFAVSAPQSYCIRTPTGIGTGEVKSLVNKTAPFLSRRTESIIGNIFPVVKRMETGKKKPPPQGGGGVNEDLAKRR